MTRSCVVLTRFVATACLMAAACSEAGDVPSGPDPLATAAVNLAFSQGGAGGVYFLPPLLRSTYSGVFAQGRSPEVRICAGAPVDPCAAPVAAFDMTRLPGQPNAQVIQAVAADEHYIVNWHSKGTAQGPHRIFVLEHGSALAHIDVIVVAHGTAVREHNTGELRVIRGGLPIKFRMEGSGEPANGLRAEYFDWSTTALDFNEALPITQRIDPQVDFADYTGGTDVFNIGQTNRFMARWTGSVQPEFSESYTFCVTTDDGARFWVDGAQLVDAWVNQNATEYCEARSLTAGEKYALKLEWYEDQGAAVARLHWESASRSREIIPTSALFPD